VFWEKGLGSVKERKRGRGEKRRRDIIRERGNMQCSAKIPL